MTGLLITRAEWGARPARGGIGTIAPEGITVTDLEGLRRQVE